MGANVTLRLDRHGFASGGGGAAAQQNFHDEVSPHLGQVTAQIEPGELRGIDLVDAGPITARHATAIIARLPTHVADRELGVVQAQLGLAPAECETREVEGQGRGNVVMIEVERGGGRCRELVSEFGQKSTRAELVATRAVQQIQAYVAHDAPVGEHLADQLLLPMAVARAGRFRSGRLSQHSTTNIDTIRQFVDVPIRVGEDERTSIVSVG